MCKVKKKLGLYVRDEQRSFFSLWMKVGKNSSIHSLSAAGENENKKREKGGPSFEMQMQDLCSCTRLTKATLPLILSGNPLLFVCFFLFSEYLSQKIHSNREKNHFLVFLFFFMTLLTNADFLMCQ